jgi:Mn-dependent DtxR family transcriptional regulator
METERITLSQREGNRLKVLHEVKQKHLSQVAAAEPLKVTDRQVRRMLRRLRERSP